MSLSLSSPPAPPPVPNVFFIPPTDICPTETAETAVMPLVTPTSAAGTSQVDDWTNKLVGKTIHDDESNETVGLGIQVYSIESPCTDQQAFCKRDLPQPSRVIKPGMMVTRDFKEDRLNVHVNDNGIVSHVTYG